MFTLKRSLLFAVLILLASNVYAFWGDTPIVWVNGRNVYVAPVFTCVTREVKAYVDNATDQNNLGIWFDVQDMDGNSLFHHWQENIPCMQATGQRWAYITNWAEGEPVGNSCEDDVAQPVQYMGAIFNTDGCHCASNQGNCPGLCDEFHDYSGGYRIADCPLEIKEPVLAGQWSPLRPNTQYKLRIMYSHLDDAVAGIRCLVTDFTYFTTGWQPPTVVALPAAVNDTTTVTFYGQIVPRWTDTMWHIEYGLTNNYGYSTPGVTMPASNGDTAVQISAQVGGLMAGKLYHWKLVGVNSGGTVESPDQTVTTSYSTPLVTTGTATQVGTNVRFTGTVDPRHAMTSYYVQIGPDTNYGMTFGGGTLGAYDGMNNVTVIGSGLVAGQTYHWRMAGTSSGGSGYGQDAVFTMSASSAPYVTTGDAKVSGNSAMVRGVVNPNGSQTSWYVAFGYDRNNLGYTQFGGNISAGYSDTQVSVTLTDLERALCENQNTGLKTGTTVHYQLVGSNTSGVTYGAIKSFNTTGEGDYLFFTNFKCAWTTVTNPNLIGGIGKRGLARNSSASLAFSGKGIRLYSMTDPTLGQMKVWVDRRKAVTVNLKAPTAYAVPVFEVTGLGSGRHTLNVKATGKRHIFVNAAELIR